MPESKRSTLVQVSERIDGKTRRRTRVAGALNFMESIVVELTSVASVAITIFGAVFCLMQTRYSKVSRVFAAFLAAVALNNTPEAFGQLIATLPSGFASVLECATWPSSFLLAPLFWLYVYVLTSPEQQMPPRLAWHFILPTASALVAILVLCSAPAIRETLFSDATDFGSPWAMTLGVAMALIQLLVLPQIAVYLIAIVGRLLRFRVRLRDVYASTEEHELRWIYVIGGLGSLFWLALALDLIATFRFGNLPSSVILASLAGFILVSATTLWGIRQHPPLAPDADPPVNTPPPGKYEKSALSAEASERLSRKLRRAMDVDHLYRDANLSLWALAEHIGASPNYISQTLNEVIGQSFFDFVNGYRIAEAKALLTTSDQSVLTITYDVGFNARSSFYNAFKRHTGQTPTKFRKKVSHRDGLDDIDRRTADS